MYYYTSFTIFTTFKILQNILLSVKIFFVTQWFQKRFLPGLFFKQHKIVDFVVLSVDKMRPIR